MKRSSKKKDKKISTMIEQMRIQLHNSGFPNPDIFADLLHHAHRSGIDVQQLLAQAAHEAQQNPRPGMTAAEHTCIAEMLRKCL